MKIGFSSAACPEWDLKTLVAKAALWGFDGVDLGGLRGDSSLRLPPELSDDCGAVRQLLSDHGVGCACLAAPATLTSWSRRTLVEQKGVVVEFMELARRLGCPCVRISAGTVDRWDTRQAALARIAEALASLAPVASRLEVTLLVENGGDFPGSADLWYLIDAVDHPAVRCCWNQCRAMTALEGPTRSIPRLGSKIGLVHLCDADFNGDGVLLDYRPLGEGQVQIARQIELLKGLMYDRYVIFHWPEMGLESLPSPEAILPGVAALLKDCREAKQPELSAYQGDKWAVKMVSP